ncbi:uncharacterized protein PFL1_05277 [Pseudozyma flocculosa PF-1]|uniref:GST N-terminal domain-containing protein n=2 Tax=Pseudozyma flocculosa TaxID=84751 RepID=A0A5C3F5F8_9BASI|nr:uncharacterized protein PFL1_05277 [Pseudozyma flocculosa PF-1]EPQ27356.1 hypothetical protein PFL1_05277 [Pseudozyma flocculosa PF-1]SPO39734.1 uncharacterized protein PSFLO_05215 [Pseudozyma flocculosa]
MTTTTATSPKIVFYDLAFYPGAPLASPNTWLTRLCLLHKRIPFEVVEPNLLDRGPTSLGKRLGKSPLFPVIQVSPPLEKQRGDNDADGDGAGATDKDDDVEYVEDSFQIALYLDRHFGAHPIFQPNLERVDMSDPSWPTILSMATILKHGYATSDSMWNKLFHLAAPGLGEIADAVEDPSFAAYFRSDQRHGKGGWAKIVGMDLETMLVDTRRSFLPFEEVLKSQSTSSRDEGARFLTTPSHVGIVDFLVFSRWAMVKACSPALADALVDADPGPMRAYLAQAAGKRIDEEEGEWWGDVRLDHFARWKERMLDLWDGAPRKALQRKGPREL